MATYSCPKGHSSTEADYCSDCGTKITPAAPASRLAAPVAAVPSCPDCGTPHELTDGKFCEICGYNFATGAHGELPLAVAPLVEQVTVKQSTAAPLADQGAPVNPAMAMNPPPGLGDLGNAADPSASPWAVVITIDPTLRHPDSPAPPADHTPVTIALAKTSTLVGRNSQMRAIYPDIALDWDDAVSHRHALINRQPNGKLTIRDIGSANGTSINQIEIAPMVDIPLNHDDAIKLGHWTQLKIIQKP
jgi:FHA domain